MTKGQTYTSNSLHLAASSSITTSDVDGTDQIAVHIGEYPTYSLILADEADLQRLYDVIGTRLSGIRLKEAA